MTLEELIKAMEAVSRNETVLIGYQCHDFLGKMAKVCGDNHAILAEQLQKIADAESPVYEHRTPRS
jgi:hypothetical protein